MVAAEADKSILNDVIAYAEAQKADASYESVIPMVKETFEAALAEAKAVAADALATDDAVFDAWVTLMGEIHKLGFVKGDISSLITLVEAAEKIVPEPLRRKRLVRVHCGAASGPVSCR